MVIFFELFLFVKLVVLLHHHRHYQRFSIYVLRRILRFVLIAIVSVVFFLVTEDLSLPWTWTDQWTIWMVVIGLVQIVVFFVGRKWKNVDDDEDEEEAQQA